MIPLYALTRLEPRQGDYAPPAPPAVTFPETLTYECLQGCSGKYTCECNRCRNCEPTCGIDWPRVAVAAFTVGFWVLVLVAMGVGR